MMALSHRLIALRIRWTLRLTQILSKLCIRLVVYSNPRPYKVTLDLNGLPLEMEIDTGAAVSIISEATQKRVFPKARLRKSSVALQIYSSEPLTVLGQMKVKVSYQGYKGTHSLLVVQGNGSNLMGRDWL